MKQTMFVGDRFKNTFGTWATVVAYKNSKKVSMKFEDSFGFVGVYSSFDIRRGKFRNPYDPNVYGLGFIGDGPEPFTINCKNTPLFNMWHAMLERCCGNNGRRAIRSYLGCTVCEEWYNFQNFASWCRKQTGFDVETRNLEKDILVKGNRVYSPETCCFVPSRINMLFVKTDSKRGEFPIGVKLDKGRYMARCKDENCQYKYIGRYDTPLEAFLAYKSYKEAVIKKVAEEYIDVLDPKVYSALINYQVEIGD